VTTYGLYKGVDDSIETKDFSESQTPGASTSLKGGYHCCKNLKANFSFS
jgi:hypothetical protein